MNPYPPRGGLDSPGLASPPASQAENPLHRLIQAALSRWFTIFVLVFGLYSLLPFLAPLLMYMGWTGPANLIYLFYSTQCHQLPQRSYFFFGSQLTYSLPEVQAAWQDTFNPAVLRQFTGSPELGWKVAWSDRMVSMYGSLLVFALLWRGLRRWIKPLSIWWFALLLLPMAVDGTTHFISDFAGIGQGFRDSNAWLASITGGALPPDFYAGDGWGSFNSLMRLLTGILFGLGVAWFGLPYLSGTLKSYQHQAPVIPASTHTPIRSQAGSLPVEPPHSPHQSPHHHPSAPSSPSLPDKQPPTGSDSRGPVDQP
jgi:uncharacterized membrane protein